MKQLLERILNQSPLRFLNCRWKAKSQRAVTMEEWVSMGKPLPPPHIVKQQTLLEYAARFGLKILVETGTYHGDMVDAMKDKFDRVYSIELSKVLFEKAKLRFQGVESIELIQGDSGCELKNIVDQIEQAALFWLDGHYSAGETAKGEKETPIYEELGHILGARQPGHVMIIDDARCFGADPAYPSVDELGDFIRSRRSHYEMIVQDDSIRVTPTL